jgi:hypothetical protein
MENANQQLVEKLKTANNVLVTVSRNPSVDQLSALIGISLLLNKQGKHCAAVFSGEVPSTLEFLKPEDTIEKTTDSLRDFIIALDKNKADKLRYKVEDNVVRIFITPYRTSISQDDLDFSQGDFNVDVVIALGVSQQEDLDEAITAHGRILHDAVVATINVNGTANLGSINWSDASASSLSELVAELAQSLGDNLLDQQVSTALLTGIVSETSRFSNDKTSSNTMTVSAALMAAGANQQLVANQLEQKFQLSQTQPTEHEHADNQPVDEIKEDKDNGILEIDHQASSNDTEAESEENDDQSVKPQQNTEADLETSQAIELPEPETAIPQEPESTVATEDIVDHQGISAAAGPGPEMITEPPSLGGTLTANANQEYLDPVTDPMTLANTQAQPQILERTPQFAPPSNSPPNNNFASDFPDLSAPLDPSLGQASGPVTSSLPPSPFPNDTFNQSNNVVSPLQPPPAPASFIDNASDNFTPPPPSWSPPPPPEPSPPMVSSASVFPAPNYDVPTNPQLPTSNNEPNQSVQPKPNIDNDGTLSQLEEAVHSPHLQQQAPAAESAREEVSKALSSASPSGPQPPIEALNAQPLGPNLHSSETIIQPNTDAFLPPPVPPPIPFQFGKPPGS